MLLSVSEFVRPMMQASLELVRFSMWLLSYPHWSPWQKEPQIVIIRLSFYVAVMLLCLQEKIGLVHKHLSQ